MSRLRVPRPSRGSFRDVTADPAVRASFLVTFLIMLGFGLIVPVLPLYARSFGVSHAQVGLLLTSFAVMRLVFDLVGGPLVDRWGERRTATAGAVIVGVSSALAAVAPSFLFLVVFRALGGAGSSILFAALMSFLVHSVPPGRMARSMTLFYSSFLLGTVAGPPIGGIIAQVLGLAAPLWFYAGACFLSGAMMLRFLSDRRREAEAAPPATAPLVLAEMEADAPVRTAWARVRRLLRDRAFVVALAANAVFFWVMGSVRMTLGPLLAKEQIGLTEGGVGAVIGAAAVTQFAVMWKAGAAADRRGRRSVLLPGLAGLFLMVAPMGWSGNAVALAALMAGLGVATGLASVAPAAIVADVAPRGRSGSAVGAYRFAGDVGFVLGPAVSGLVADAFGFPAAFLAAAAPVLVVLPLAMGMPETLGRQRAGRSAGSGGAPATVAG